MDNINKWMGKRIRFDLDGEICEGKVTDVYKRCRQYRNGVVVVQDNGNMYTLDPSKDFVEIIK